jgi:carbamoyltransferase
VSPEEYPEYHRILAAYHKRTGNSHIINTSFNMHEEPIVSGPQDALRAFRASGLPFLAVGNFWVEADEDVL